MCVAVSLEGGTSVTTAELSDMQRGNPHGAGIAWVEEGKVHWVKDRNASPGMLQWVLTQKQAFPRLLHFRYGTAGENVTGLCHPFTLDLKAETSPFGVTDSPAVIHNGTWSGWTEVYQEVKELLPDGPWSDTRLACWLAVTDPGWLDQLISKWGRIAILHKDGSFAHMGDWQDLRPGIKVSNKSWQPTVYTGAGSYGHFGGRGTYVPSTRFQEWENKYKEYNQGRSQRGQTPPVAASPLTKDGGGRLIDTRVPSHSAYDDDAEEWEKLWADEDATIEVIVDGAKVRKKGTKKAKDKVVTDAR